MTRCLSTSHAHCEEVQARMVQKEVEVAKMLAEAYEAVDAMENMAMLVVGQTED